MANNYEGTDWIGQGFPEEFLTEVPLEKKMRSTLKHVAPINAIYATPENYEYYAHFYSLRKPQEDLCRQRIVRNLGKFPDNPLRFQDRLFPDDPANRGYFPFATPFKYGMAAAAVGGALYVLKFCK